MLPRSPSRLLEICGCVLGVPGEALEQLQDLGG